MKKKTSHVVLILVILSMLLSACDVSRPLVVPETRGWDSQRLSSEQQIIGGMKGNQKSGVLKATPRQSLMSVAEAKQALREALEKSYHPGAEPLQNIEIYNDGFKFFTKGEAGQLFGNPVPYAKTISCKFSDIQTKSLLGDTYLEINGEFAFYLPREKAKQFKDAVISMKYHFSNQLIYDDSAAFAGFQEKAKAWRVLPQKPAIPEEIRRFRVQAEDAFRNKEFDKTIDYYEKGLEVYPLWPEGYFNAALLCGEVGIYAKAICHMRRYLELSPDAKDAQAARDKMFIWEGKLGSSQFYGH